MVIENDLQSTGESRKLDVRFKGPYRVSKVLGNDRYLLEDVEGISTSQKKFCSVYASDKMKPWCALLPESTSDDEDDTDIEDDVHCQERPSCHV